jgi:hypothetical protein
MTGRRNFQVAAIFKKRKLKLAATLKFQKRGLHVELEKNAGGNSGTSYGKQY